jgi:glycosyltransferase involved in cell wall biosynthesis
MSPPSERRPKVLLLLPYLGRGGSQHITATLARHLDKDGYQVHLALLTQSDSNCPDIPPSVTVHCLSARRARYAALQLLCLVWRVSPAIVFVGMAHLGPLVLLLRIFFPSRTRVILRQSGALSAILGAAGPPGLVRMIFAAAYRRADMVICQTRSTAEELQTEFHLQAAQLAVLPNPIEIDRIRYASSPARNGHNPRNPYLFAAGRLVHEKGFDLLMKAFARLQPDFPTLRLLIAGSGPTGPALEVHCKVLGIDDRVEFLGDVPWPPEYFPRALAFVLSSRQDELPNALLEAAAGGLPIVSTPASPGLSDLLCNRPGVWLASATSVEALEIALRNALSTITPQQRFTHEWIKSYDLKGAVTAYERVFDQAAKVSTT